MSSEPIEVTYDTADGERRLQLHRGERRIVLAQSERGYGMVVVRHAGDGTEIERYYGLEMALDHAAELLGVHPSTIEIPPDAADMGL